MTSRMFALALALAMSIGLRQLTAAQPESGYLVCVSNERSGDVTVIDGASGEVVATIPVGKRPRGIHASPDGRTLYVALSGYPNLGPPKLDAQGNPVFEETVAEEDIDASAHGIGVVDLRQRKFQRKLPAGSDPEEFAVSPDGQWLYVSNEDVATASVVNVADGEVKHIIRVKQEPEGVALSPDGRHCYVTCETGGEIFVIDTRTQKSIAEFTVGGRPRTVAFLPDGTRAFIPSETTGIISVVDTAKFEVLGTIRLPDGSRPMGTAISGDGKQLYVSTGRAGTVVVVDTVSGEAMKVIAVGKRPWGIAVSPDGSHLYVANGPSNDVSVIDVAAAREIAKIPAGQSPWGVAIVRVSQ